MAPQRPSIFTPPRNCATVSRAAQAGVIVDACDYYVAFYRAAVQARRYILLSGWQFDSNVELLRGDDTALAKDEGGALRLLPFLNHLCETRPDLEINILAWDFHVVLALEREWIQKILFHWKTHPRVRFHFNACHPAGGCHHQKFVVVDGHLAFLGGIDLCEARWDDRKHLSDNPVRLSHKKPQKPYHDAQVYLAGHSIVQPLTDLFVERWRRAGSDPLQLGPALDPPGEPYQARGALPLPAGNVALSVTDPQDCGGTPLRQIAELFGEAIAAAESLIYIETQYLSSREIRAHLERRMRAPDRPRLQLVVVVNERAEAVKEEIAVGLRQAENLKILRAAAHDTGHAFGCYFSVADHGGNILGAEKPTYIHTKVLLIDDHFLSIGSANLTNRSMGLDTELHASWDVSDHENPEELARAIRDVRLSLLAEHAGLTEETARTLTPHDGLVGALDALAGDGQHRLRLHPSPTQDEDQALAVVNPQKLPFDPAGPDDTASELAEDSALLRASLSDIFDLITSRKAD